MSANSVSVFDRPCVNCQGGSTEAELHFCGKRCACEWVINLSGSEWPDIPLPASSIVWCERMQAELVGDNSTREAIRVTLEDCS